MKRIASSLLQASATLLLLSTASCERADVMPKSAGISAATSSMPQTTAVLDVYNFKSDGNIFDYNDLIPAPSPYTSHYIFFGWDQPISIIPPNTYPYAQSATVSLSGTVRGRFYTFPNCRIQESSSSAFHNNYRASGVTVNLEPNGVRILPGTYNVRVVADDVNGQAATLLQGESVNSSSTPSGEAMGQLVVN